MYQDGEDEGTIRQGGLHAVRCDPCGQSPTVRAAGLGAAPARIEPHLLSAAEHPLGYFISANAEMLGDVSEYA